MQDWERDWESSENNIQFTAGERWVGVELEFDFSSSKYEYRIWINSQPYGPYPLPEHVWRQGGINLDGSINGLQDNPPIRGLGVAEVGVRVTAPGHKVSNAYWDWYDQQPWPQGTVLPGVRTQVVATRSMSCLDGLELKTNSASDPILMRILTRQEFDSVIDTAGIFNARLELMDILVLGGPGIDKVDMARAREELLASSRDLQSGGYSVVSVFSVSTDLPPYCPNPFVTYNWTFTEVPAASRLTNDDIVNSTDAAAFFLPDVQGTYGLKLVAKGPCSEFEDSTKVQGYCNNIPVVVASATNEHWTADFGLLMNDMCYAFARLDSTGTFDIDGDEIDLLWEVDSAPPGSMAVAGAIDRWGRGGAWTTPVDLEAADETSLITKLYLDRPGDFRVRLSVTDGCTVATAELDIRSEWAAECNGYRTGLVAVLAVILLLFASMMWLVWGALTPKDPEHPGAVALDAAAVHARLRLRQELNAEVLRKETMQVKEGQIARFELAQRKKTRAKMKLWKRIDLELTVMFEGGSTFVGVRGGYMWVVPQPGVILRGVANVFKGLAVAITRLTVACGHEAVSLGRKEFQRRFGKKNYNLPRASVGGFDYGTGAKPSFVYESAEATRDVEDDKSDDLFWEMLPRGLGEVGEDPRLGPPPPKRAPRTITTRRAKAPPKKRVRVVPAVEAAVAAARGDLSSLPGAGAKSSGQMVQDVRRMKGSGPPRAGVGAQRAAGEDASVPATGGGGSTTDAETDPLRNAAGGQVGQAEMAAPRPAGLAMVLGPMVCPAPAPGGGESIPGQVRSRPTSRGGGGSPLAAPPPQELRRGPSVGHSPGEGAGGVWREMRRGPSLPPGHGAVAGVGVAVRVAGGGARGGPAAASRGRGPPPPLSAVPRSYTTKGPPPPAAVTSEVTPAPPGVSAAATASIWAAPPPTPPLEPPPPPAPPLSLAASVTETYDQGERPLPGGVAVTETYDYDDDDDFWDEEVDEGGGYDDGGGDYGGGEGGYDDFGDEYGDEYGGGGGGGGGYDDFGDDYGGGYGDGGGGPAWMHQSKRYAQQRHKMRVAVDGEKDTGSKGPVGKALFRDKDGKAFSPFATRSAREGPEPFRIYLPTARHVAMWAALLMEYPILAAYICRPNMRPFSIEGFGSVSPWLFGVNHTKLSCMAWALMGGAWVWALIPGLYFRIILPKKTKVFQEQLDEFEKQIAEAKEQDNIDLIRRKNLARAPPPSSIGGGGGGDYTDYDDDDYGDGGGYGDDFGDDDMYDDAASRRTSEGAYESYGAAAPLGPHPRGWLVPPRPPRAARVAGMRPGSAETSGWREVDGGGNGGAQPVVEGLFNRKDASSGGLKKKKWWQFWKRVEEEFKWKSDEELFELLKSDKAAYLDEKVNRYMRRRKAFLKAEVDMHTYLTDTSNRFYFFTSACLVDLLFMPMFSALLSVLSCRYHDRLVPWPHWSLDEEFMCYKSAHMIFSVAAGFTLIFLLLFCLYFAVVRHTHDRSRRVAPQFALAMLLIKAGICIAGVMLESSVGREFQDPTTPEADEQRHDFMLVVGTGGLLLMQWYFQSFRGFGFSENNIRTASYAGAAFLAAVNLAYKFHHGMGYEVDVYLTYDADSGSRRAPDTALPPLPEGGGLYAYLLFATPVAMAAVMMLGYTRAARATLPGTPSEALVDSPYHRIRAVGYLTFFRSLSQDDRLMITAIDMRYMADVARQLFTELGAIRYNPDILKESRDLAPSIATALSHLILKLGHPEAHVNLDWKRTDVEPIHRKHKSLDQLSTDIMTGVNRADLMASRMMKEMGSGLDLTTREGLLRRALVVLKEVLTDDHTFEAGCVGVGNVAHLDLFNHHLMEDDVHFHTGRYLGEDDEAWDDEDAYLKVEDDAGDENDDDNNDASGPLSWMKAQLKEAAEAKKPVKAAGVFRCLLGGLRNPKEPLRQGAALKAMLSLCHSHHLMSRMCSPKGVRRVLSCSISLNDTVRSLSAAVIAKLLEDSHLWAKIVTHVFFIIATAHDNTPNHVATMIVVRGLECLAKLVRTGCDITAGKQDRAVLRLDQLSVLMDHHEAVVRVSAVDVVSMLRQTNRGHQALMSRPDLIQKLTKMERDDEEQGPRLAAGRALMEISTADDRATRTVAWANAGDLKQWTKEDLEVKRVAFKKALVSSVNKAYVDHYHSSKGRVNRIWNEARKARKDPFEGMEGDMERINFRLKYPQIVEEQKASQAAADRWASYMGSDAKAYLPSRDAPPPGAGISGGEVEETAVRAPAGLPGRGGRAGSEAGSGRGGAGSVSGHSGSQTARTMRSEMPSLAER